MNSHTAVGGPAGRWFKSSYSNPSQDCVEVRFVGGMVQVRDSKERGVPPVLTVPAGSWRGFVRDAARGA